MKAMILSDLIIMKKVFISQTLLSAVVAIFIAIGMSNIYVVVPFFSCMAPFVLMFSLLAYDERNGWEAFRLTFPFSRAQLIVGRYLSFLICTVFCTIIGYILFGIFMLFIQVTHDILPLSDLLINFSWQAVLLPGIAGASILITLSALVLPLATRFGMTKAVRWVPLGAMFGGALIYAGVTFFSDGTMPQLLIDLRNLLLTEQGAIIVSITILAIALALYAISCTIAVKLYQTREL